MAKRGSDDLEREFARMTRPLEIARRQADRVRVVNPPEHRAERGLFSLRAIAALGVVAAVAFVIYAFTLHPLLGVTGFFVSPGIPLGLTILTDRLRRMKI